MAMPKKSKQHAVKVAVHKAAAAKHQMGHASAAPKGKKHK